MKLLDVNVAIDAVLTDPIVGKVTQLNLDHFTISDESQQDVTVKVEGDCLEIMHRLHLNRCYTLIYLEVKQRELWVGEIDF